MDKFTKFPNELLVSAAKYEFTATQYAVLLYLVRQTYGYGIYKRKISISMTAKHLGRKRQVISRAINDMEKMGVITIEREKNGKAPVVWINKPENWDKPATAELHVTGEFHVTEKLQVPATAELHPPATAELQDLQPTGCTLKDTIKDNGHKDKSKESGSAALFFDVCDVDPDEIRYMPDDKKDVVERIRARGLRGINIDDIDEDGGMPTDSVEALRRAEEADGHL